LSAAVGTEFVFQLPAANQLPIPAIQSLACAGRDSSAASQNDIVRTMPASKTLRTGRYLDAPRGGHTAFCEMSSIAMAYAGKIT
jgi:hypothetical protein